MPYSHEKRNFVIHSPKAITALYEASLEEARDQWAKDHSDEIAETVFGALLKKSI
jgi:hypothetical protein